MSVLLLGLAAGQSDRKLPYRFYADNLRCEGLPLITKFNDLYLAVRKDNSRVLLDKDCKVKLEVPASKDKLLFEMSDWPL
jgi:hypothetical protein